MGPAAIGGSDRCAARKWVAMHRRPGTRRARNGRRSKGRGATVLARGGEVRELPDAEDLTTRERERLGRELPDLNADPEAAERLRAAGFTPTGLPLLGGVAGDARPDGEC